MEMEMEMDRDEEDDQGTLIHQNNTQRTRNLRNRISGLGFNKRYLIAFLLFPLFILIIYFATDLKILFHSSVSGIKFHSSIDRMRESQLRPLYLLRQQQLGLFKLTSLNNSNSANSTSDDTNSVPGDHLFEYLKSSVLNQISLNKQIQQVLLSSYKTPGFNSNISDSSLSGYADVIRCGKVDQMLSNRRSIQWKPQANKYLFAICVSGQMSNHLICLEKHMFFAALLNRVLVIPSPKVDYEFNRVLGIGHINKCLGREVVVTFEEFAEKKKNHLHIDKVICYFSLPHPCYMDYDHVKKLKLLGVSMSRPDAAWVEDVKKPHKRRADDVLRKFSCDDGVIAVGDLYFADVEKEWVMQAGGPIAHNCKTLVEPSRLIMLTAQRFIQTFLGDNFIALHFRRRGFLKFCNAKRRSCFFPIPQAADCINGVIEKASSGVIYLSTDAAESETSLLESLLVLNGKSVPLVKRPSRNSAEKWDALLYRHGLEQDPQVEAMLDKTICGLSKVFIGSSGSTFTEDILRLRKDWGSASLCDEYLCQGQVPNFIAGGEDD